jgi:hypothetical protein
MDASKAKKEASETKKSLCVVDFTACHNNAPQKGWRHNWSSLSASAQHGVCRKK